MRRSILLAICDFLILSALSLSSGVTQYNNQTVHINSTGDAESTELVPDKTWKSEFKVTVEQIQLIKAQKEIERLATNESKLREKQIKTQNEIAKKEENIKALELVNNEMANRNNNLVKKINHDKSLIRNIDTIVQDLSSENKQLSTELNKKLFRIDSLGEINSNLTNLNKQMSENLLAKEKQISVLGERTETLKSSFRELENVIAVKDKTISQIKNSTESILEEKTTLEKMIEEQKHSLNQVSKEKETLQKEHSILKQILNDTQLVIDKERQNKKRELFAKDTQLEDTIDELKRKEDELKRLQLKLAKLSQGNGFVWEKYSGSSVKLDVKIIDTSSSTPKIKTSTGFIPEINIAGTNYLVAEFSSLGLSWNRIIRNQITTLDIIVGEKTHVTSPIKYIKDSPKVCFIQTKVNSSKTDVKTIGYERLLKRGLDDIYLFKRNGNSSELKCYFSSTEPGYVFTKNASSTSTTLSASPGDFLLTKKGLLIGVFVSHSKCYIIPPNLNRNQLAEIPITKPDNDKYYKEFSETIKLLQKK